MKKQKSTPQIIKAFTFDDMIKDVTENGRKAHEKFLQDGLCQSNSDGKECTDKANPKYVSQGYHLCDKHMKEVNDMLEELGKDPGFMKMTLRF